MKLPPRTVFTPRFYNISRKTRFIPASRAAIFEEIDEIDESGMVQIPSQPMNQTLKKKKSKFHFQF
jgi:hypothetical protein